LPGSKKVLFSEPVAAPSALEPMNYTISPIGEVDGLEVDPDDTRAILVQLLRFGYGTDGEEPRLTIQDVQGQSGSRLQAEGVAIALERRSDDLADLRIFPNPLRLNGGQERLQIRGLVAGATIRIISLVGETLRVYEDVGNGPLVWDARDETGALIPSGVYFIHVEHSDGAEVLRKVAVIR